MAVYVRGTWLGDFLGFETRMGSNLGGQFKYRLVKVKVPSGKTMYLRDFTTVNQNIFTIK